MVKSRVVRSNSWCWAQAHRVVSRFDNEWNRSCVAGLWRESPQSTHFRMSAKEETAVLILRTYEAMCPTCDNVTDVGLPDSFRAESQGVQLRCWWCGTDWVLKAERVGRRRPPQLRCLNIRHHSATTRRLAASQPEQHRSGSSELNLMKKTLEELRL